jgi:hypothetical protein
MSRLDSQSAWITTFPAVQLSRQIDDKLTATIVRRMILAVRPYLL